MDLNVLALLLVKNVTLRARYELGAPSYYNIPAGGNNVCVKEVQNAFESWRQRPVIAGGAFSQLFHCNA
jgi:hypothetical protein